MSRSRSSFDLSGAIATATTLATAPPTVEEQPAAFYKGMPLVSFGPTASGPATVLPPEGVQEPPRPPPPPAPPPPISVQEQAPQIVPAINLEASQPEIPVPEDTARRPPKLPDLSAIVSPVERCEKIIDWIVDAVGASDVFIADAAGLPVAGLHADAEARLAASGVVAQSIAHLAASVPGNASTLFELHVGDGPFFQLIGFDVADAQYVVGLLRGTPLGFRQAHAVRLACKHALTLSDGIPAPADSNGEQA